MGVTQGQECAVEHLQPGRAHAQRRLAHIVLGIAASGAHLLSQPVPIGGGILDEDVRPGRIADAVALAGDEMREHSVLRQRVLGHALDQRAAEGEEIARADQELTGPVAGQPHLVHAIGEQVRPVAQHRVAWADADRMSAHRPHPRVGEGGQQQGQRILGNDHVPVAEHDDVAPRRPQPNVQCRRLAPLGIGHVPHNRVAGGVIIHHDHRRGIGADDHNLSIGGQLRKKGFDSLAYGRCLVEGGDEHTHACVHTHTGSVASRCHSIRPVAGSRRRWTVAGAVVTTTSSVGLTVASTRCPPSVW